MAYLQLAEDNPYNRLAEGNPMKNYIFIPAGMFGQTKDNYVREDFFDDLPNAEYLKVIETLAPYQNTGLNGILDFAAGFIPGVGPVASKVVGGLVNRRKERVASGQAKPIFKPGGLVDRVKGKLNKAKAESATDAAPTAPGSTAVRSTVPPISGSVTVGGTTAGINYNPQSENFFTKYKKPLLYGGLGLAALGIGYAVLKKK